ncbi:MAG: 3-phosphoshikimate 1-carboxyvinyltransferase [Coriobacteriia bacterium]|nr:3-phosphoshikimate 1-carboxyvinyltransferase [Coriobacteriia bacterium]
MEKTTEDKRPVMDGFKVIRRFPEGIVTPPPSKSLGHRAIICAALACRVAGGAGDAYSVIENLGESDDIKASLEGIRSLGADWALEGSRLEVFGAAAQTGQPIDCYESGSTLRFLLPLLALEERESVFVGRGRLLERPLGVYQEVFEAAGASLTQSADAVRVRGVLRNGSYHLPGDVSSQFVSGLLMALPLLDEDSELVLDTPLQSGSYVDLTRAVMRYFGVETEQPEAMRFYIPGNQQYQPARYQVESDYSQAAYFLAAAALGRPVWCQGLNPDSAQGDRAFIEILKQMGAELVYQDDLVTVRAGRLAAVSVDVGDIPDLVPPLATLCCFCQGTSYITNASRLRLKESDRLSAMASELGKLGALIVEGDDYLSITGVDSLSGNRVDAWSDHRIAMSMGLAAIRTVGQVELSGWQSVAKSYPHFWQDFERSELSGDMSLEPSEQSDKDTGSGPGSALGQVTERSNP